MPELPEISQLASQMNTHLVGKTFFGIEILQPKCLNIPVEEFTQNLVGAQILSASSRGKWVFVETSQGWLLLNLGMGGEILLIDRGHLPEKRRLIFDFVDGSCLSVNFWWFGNAHYAAAGNLADHKPTARLGPNVLDLSLADFNARLTGQKTAVKTYLLDQNRVAGIGNSYIHEILFQAKIHPLRKINTLTMDEIKALYDAVHAILQSSLDQGGAFYEMDLFGRKGGFTVEQYGIGYRPGQLCPVCTTPIEKIKTGGTTSFICPVCQV